MRKRTVNQRALEKLSLLIFEVRGRLANKENLNFSQLYNTYNVSKSTISVAKKLGYIIEVDGYLTWNNPDQHSDRVIGLKILEALRQQSDKQSDKPISDLWVAEINSIKSLLSEIRSNTKDRATGLKSTSISERVYLAGQIASGIYMGILKYIQNQNDTASIDGTSDFIISATDDLLKKLNS